MIQTPILDTGAEFSPCRTWRYRLWRTWDRRLARLVMLMLNPSTADEVSNDPTVERCERRARGAGFGGLLVLNAFAFRATDPEIMKAARDPIGPGNNSVIADAMVDSIECGDLLCAGWGVHGSHLGRDRQLIAMAQFYGAKLHCLGTTKFGQPRHPLYVAYSQPFVAWGPSPAANSNTPPTAVSEAA